MVVWRVVSSQTKAGSGAAATESKPKAAGASSNWPTVDGERLATLAGSYVWGLHKWDARHQGLAFGSEWCRMMQSASTYPPHMSERIRLTITVTPEVHEVFTRMSVAGGISLGKCMGEWLGDTIEGAQFVAHKMEEARKAPRVVMREMQAFTRGLSDEVDAVAVSMRRQPAQSAARRQPAGAVPPSSNTGGKSPGKTRNSGGGS